MRIAELNFFILTSEFFAQSAGLVTHYCLWQQIRDLDGSLRGCESGYSIRRKIMRAGPIAVSVQLSWHGDRVAVDLKTTIKQIHDPIFRDAGAGVQARLLSSVKRESGLGYLHHQ